MLQIYPAAQFTLVNQGHLLYEGNVRTTADLVQFP